MASSTMKAEVPTSEVNEQQITGARKKDDRDEDESPVEANKKMRVKTLERANRVAEKVRSISFSKKS